MTRFLLRLALPLALGAAALPLVRGRGPLAAAGYVVAVTGLTLIPSPHIPGVAILVATVSTGLALGIEPYARRPRERRPEPVEETTAATAATPIRDGSGTGRRYTRTA